MDVLSFRQFQLSGYEINEEEQKAHLDNLRAIEEQLDAQFGVVRHTRDSNDEDGSEENGEDGYTCVICDKEFKSE